VWFRLPTHGLCLPPGLSAMRPVWGRPMLSNCHCYKLALIKGLFERRSDFDVVKLRLKGIIEAEFEVVPLSFLVAMSHRAMYVSDIA
jgi:hypothetical protein